MGIYRFDDSFRDRGYRKIAGIDEAGRGPLAGPVVAAAVILPSSLRIEGLRDSKKIPENERQHIYQEILSSAVDIGVGISEVDVIERLNILGATKNAMEAAVKNLAKSIPDFVLIDAVKLPSLNIDQESPVKGDSLSASIAAASVVAKVVRDGLMRNYHDLYPVYGFNRNKGYGTKKHLEAIKLHGPCPLHRKGFRGVMSLELPF
jgi:ribonuclease HII